MDSLVLVILGVFLGLICGILFAAGIIMSWTAEGTEVGDSVSENYELNESIKMISMADEHRVLLPFDEATYL
jgi:3-phosphoglycerate kinase